MSFSSVVPCALCGKRVGFRSDLREPDGKTTTVNYTDYSGAQPEKGSAVYDKQ